MRTDNQHPQWHNEPLRLGQQELQDPVKVLREFFNSFHLQEVRETLWEWMVEIVVSDRSGHSSTDRSNAIFFYEKLEELIEASFVIGSRELP